MSGDWIIEIRRYKVCKKCNKFNTWYAEYCEHCNNDVLIPDYIPKNWKCPQCGQINPINILDIDFFCNICNFKPIIYFYDK
jgi:hypothetical protein